MSKQIINKITGKDLLVSILNPYFLLKKHYNKVKENKLIFSSLFRIEERLLVGKKPPEEITDNARFSEMKDLNSKILYIKKIIKVSKI